MDLIKWMNWGWRDSNGLRGYEKSGEHILTATAFD